MDAEIDDSAINFGFLISHANIRFMELVLHISYRLEIEKWRVSSSKIVKFISTKIII